MHTLTPEKGYCNSFVMLYALLYGFDVLTAIEQGLP
jgi:hypothetical protein